MKRFSPLIWMTIILTVLIGGLAVGDTSKGGEPTTNSTASESTPEEKTVEAPRVAPVALPVAKSAATKEEQASGVSGAKIVLPPPPSPEPSQEPVQAESPSPNSSSKSSEAPKEQSSPKEQNEPAPAPKPQKSKWDQCIDRVDPGRTVDWRKGNYGHYGQASTNYVLLGNHTPDHRKCAVVYHEWFHTVHARKEGGIDSIINTYGRNRLESITDCGALMLGADWVGYGCGGEADRQKAREILGW